MTTCQTKFVEASTSAEAASDNDNGEGWMLLGGGGGGVEIPTCDKKTGLFEYEQCAAMFSCRCVDIVTGNDIPGTYTGTDVQRSVTCKGERKKETAE